MLRLLFTLQLCISEQSSRKFVVAGSCLAITIAATQTTSETEYWKKRMVAISSVWNMKSITNTDLKRAKYTEFIQVSAYSFIFPVFLFEANLQFCIRILEIKPTTLTRRYKNSPFSLEAGSI